MIQLNNVTYTYSPKTPFEKTAVDDVTLELETGEILGIIGHTGSGKSTMIQLMNGLLMPTSGEALLNGEKITKVTPQVGMVFQYPENQIFEETIRDEIAFGPKNLGVESDEITRRIDEVCEIMGIDSDLNKSPHFLSGGQKRRIAIASVLAMKPIAIIFDEPTAGLDPRAKNQLMNTIVKLNKEQGVTIAIVSHSMEDIAKICTRVAVMKDAKIAMVGTPAEVFARADELVGMGLDIPEIAQLMRKLGHNDCWTVEQAMEVLAP